MKAIASKGLLLLAFLGLGCDPEVKDPPPVENDTSVRVRSVERYHTANGVVERPADFTTSPVELFVLEGGTFRSIPGAPGSAGEFEFQDVPDGTYYIKRGSLYTITSARRVDLGNHRLGRADQEPIPSTSSRPQAWLDIDGLEPWPSADEQNLAGLELVSGEVDVTGSLGTGSVLGLGQTSVEGRSVSFNNLVAALPYRFEQARGDRAWVNQFMPRGAGTLPDGSTQRYSTVVRSLYLPPFSFDGSGYLPVSGTFQSLPMKEFSLDWRLSAFTSQAAAAHPAASISYTNFSIYPAAHGLDAAGWVGYSGELLTLDMPDNHSSDFSGQLVYGNPFPSTWGEVASGGVSFVVEYTVPGATEPLGYSANLSVTDRASALSGQPLQPRILQPRAMKIDGGDASESRPLALGSHVISWQPPASGQVSAYRMRLMQYQVESGWARRKGLVTFAVTPGVTSVQLPADVLKPASYYLIELSAVSIPGYTVEDAGSLYSVPYAVADTLSGLLSTP